MPPTTMQYTLVGFTAELDWRPLRFVRPLPQNRVCGACRIVRPKTALLPCGHTLCGCCYEHCAQEGLHICPLDGCECQEEDVDWRTFAVEDLLKREVKCWNEGAGCQHVTTASGIAAHFRCECEHHCVFCPKCSGAVVFGRVVTHMKSAICNPVTPLGSKYNGQSGQKRELATLMSFSFTFQEQMDEVKELLGKIAGDTRTHGDRLNEVFHGINTLREAVSQEVVAETRPYDNSLMPSEHGTTAYKEEASETLTTVIDRFDSLSGSITRFEKTLKDELDYLVSRSQQKFSQIATAIDGVKAAADENIQNEIQDIKIILRHAELAVSHCVFFVKNVNALQCSAKKNGIAVYESEQTYLRGYCMSPGVAFINYNQSVKLEALVHLHKGRMDGAVQWPFERTIKLSVIHPNKGAERVFQVKTSRSCECYQRPAEASNSGVHIISESLNVTELVNEGYVEADQLRVKYELLP